MRIYLPRGKKSFIHKARKERNDPVDTPEIWKLIRILRDYFGLVGLTGEVFKTLEGLVYPDVYNKSHQIAFELDGEYHGYGDDISTSDGTWKRNSRYKSANIKLIIINKAATHYSDKAIIEVLETHGLVRIRDAEE